MNFSRQTDPQGENPFDYLAFKTDMGGVKLVVKSDSQWGWSRDFPNAIPWSSVAYNLGGHNYHTFSTLFRVYDWNNAGSDNLGDFREILSPLPPPSGGRLEGGTARTVF